MPLFYLSIRCEDDFVQDDEGMDFADLRAARVEAVKSARSIMCEAVQHGMLDLNQSIELQDQDGQYLESVRFADVLTIAPLVTSFTR